MDIKELRIGNIIRTKDSITPYWEINDFDMIVMSHKNYENMDMSTYLPIEITEEWLFKLGFKNVRYEKYAHEKVDKLKAYPHVFNDGFGFYLQGSYSFPHIKYVHQLQNLYLSLTGEELTIKQ